MFPSCRATSHSALKPSGMDTRCWLKIRLWTAVLPLVNESPNIRFYAGYPLHGSNGNRIGTLCIFDTQSRKFSPEDLDLLGGLAYICEAGLEACDVVDLQKHLIEIQERLLRSQERLSSEVQSAAKFVRSLLPQPLEAPIRARYLYEPSSELGGDCFYYRWIHDDLFIVYAIDVAGHGISSALLAVSILNALNGLIQMSADITPSMALEGINQAFQMKNQGNRFTAAWLGFYRPSTQILEYAGAGFPDPLHLHWDVVSGKPALATLSAAGLPLGVLETSKYPSK